MNKPSYCEAVIELVGADNCGGGLSTGPISEINLLNDVTPPTEAEIDAKLVELQAEYDAQAYARNRSTEYPALAEQLDEIYHNGIASWKATIKVTKDKYPKG
jgi:hypothetical protein